MKWNELFNDLNEPSDSQIKGFVDTPLWDDLGEHLQQTYKIQPKLSYSNCSMDNGIWKGWNVKYKKGGKALCTLYPQQGYFLALMPVGLSQINEVELLMPLCSEYTQRLFEQTPSHHLGKSLAFEVKNENTLADIKKLMVIRAESMKKGKPK